MGNVGVFLARDYESGLPVSAALILIDFDHSCTCICVL